MAEALPNSCTPVFVELALRLGTERMYPVSYTHLCDPWGIPADFFKQNDIHIHVPEDVYKRQPVVRAHGPREAGPAASRTASRP